MQLAVWFWILMLLWVLFGAWYGYSAPAADRAGRWGGWLLPFLLFILLGLKAFGSPLAG